MSRPLSIASLPIALLLLCHCHAGKVGPAPPPRRPKPKKVEKKAPRHTDCSRLTPADELPALKYAERSIDEAQNLAEQGFTMLRQAEKNKADEGHREDLIRQAVERFITALKADPYNVHATYNLAAAYARIGRAQCAVNLLERLAALRQLPSQRAKVEQKLDRLFGRGKYDGRLDPDFFDLRDDRRFRRVARKLQ